MRYKFFKEQYSFHLEQRDSLLNTLSFVMIPYGLVLAGVAFYANQFFETLLPEIAKSGLNNCSVTATLIFLATLVVFVVLTAYFIVRAFHNFQYEYLAPPEVIDRYYSDLVAYHAQYPGQGTVEDDFRQYLTNAYVLATATNSSNNATRRRYCHLATRTLIYSIIMAVIAYLPIMCFKKEPGPQKIEIINKPLEVQKHVQSKPNPQP